MEHFSNTSKNRNCNTHKDQRGTNFISVDNTTNIMTRTIPQAQKEKSTHQRAETHLGQSGRPTRFPNPDDSSVQHI